MAKQNREIWRAIPGYETRYQASSLGRIRSVRKGIILTRRLHRDFYAKTNLKIGRKSRTFHIHTLIALTFLGPRPPGYVIDHIDGDHTNDAAKNLRYLSPSESNFNRKQRGDSRQSTGTPYVYKHAYGGFYVRVFRDGKNIRLGYFQDLNQAIATVEQWQSTANRRRRLSFAH